MRKLALILWLCLALPLLAGNRADLNGDQAVDALDLALLGNVLSGNLDVASYNLSNVVVVAPQGGDFTDPADAADWVAAQGPNLQDRYVILITPGRYYPARTVQLPRCTSLVGYGPEASQLHYTASESTPPYGAIVSCDNVDNVAVVGLGLLKFSGTTGGGNAAVFIRDSQTIKIRECRVYSWVNGDEAFGIYVAGANESTEVEISDCRIEMASDSGYPLSALAGIGDISATVRMADTWVTVFQNQSTQLASMAVYQANDHSRTPDFKAFSCQFHVQGTLGPEYYFARADGHTGNAYFYTSQITRGTSNTASFLWLVHCYGLTAAM
jgi:hypothetical protein